MERDAYISTANILDEFGVEVRFLDDLLQQRIGQEVQLCVLESSLEGFT